MSKVYTSEHGWVGWDHPPANRPESPWRKRYGGSSDPTFCEETDEVQSGFRPICPDIEEPYGLEGNPDAVSLDRYRQELANNDGLGFDRPDSAELDLLFLSERFQTKNLHGIRTWQLASINMPPRPSPGAFTVNEEAWHDVFAKSHWFDYRQDRADPSAPPGNTWSVDDPALWEQLAPCVELANRYLNVLIHTQWFYSLMVYSDLHPHYHPTKLVRSVGGALDNIPPIPDPANPNETKYRVPWFPVQPSSTPLTEEEIEFNRSEVEKRGAGILWTFLDNQDAQGEAINYNITIGGVPFGLTDRENTTEGQGYGSCSLARINTDFLIPLMSPPQTPEDGVERTILQSVCALTIVHELMHALYDVGQHPFGTEVHEPLMGDEWKSELGHSMERALFGGVLVLKPIAGAETSAPLSSAGYRPLAMSLAPWPKTGPLTNDMGWVDKEFHQPHTLQTVEEPVIHPALLSLVVSDTFWNNKSAPDLLRDLNLANSAEWTRMDAPLTRGTSARLKPGADSRQARDWVQRTKVWRSIRSPWYQEQYTKWQLTPYSLLEPRSCVSRFERFAKANDLHACVATTAKLAWELRNHYRFLVRNHVVPPDLEAERVEPIIPSHAPTHYLFAVLLTLMRATIKWEPVEVQHPSVRRHMPPLANRWHPSFQASRSRPDRTMYPQHEQPQDPIENDFTWGGGRQAPGINQASLSPKTARLRLLREAEDHLAFFAYRFQILSQEPFVRAVEATIAHLKAEAMAKGEHYKGWLTWPFVLPEYDGTLKMGGCTQDDTTVWNDVDHGDNKVIRKKMKLVLEMIASPAEQPPPDDETLLAKSLGRIRITEARVVIGIDNPDDAQPSGTAYNVQQTAADISGPSSRKRRRMSRRDSEPLLFQPRRTNSRGRRQMQRKYWTIGQVGNHSSDDDRWALVEYQHGKFEVYDVTDHPLLQTKKGLEKFTVMTQHGLVLHPDAYPWALENPRVGLLILQKDLEDLFEMDGKDGRPHWVYAGRDIYDLADVSSATPSELAALRSSHQGDAATAAEKHGIPFSRLRSILTVPCATIRFHHRRPHPPGHTPFTMESLGSYIFPRQGRVYMAIDNIVYNIRDLASTHPGGSNLITTLSGRDATAEFKRDHPDNWADLLQRMEKVGHVVPTLSWDRFGAPRADEINLRDDCWVYRVTRKAFVEGMMEWILEHRNTRKWELRHWEEKRRELEAEFEALEPWLGRVNVDAEGEGIQGVVASLRMLGGLVVGRRPVLARARGGQREITRGELKGWWARLREGPGGVAGGLGLEGEEDPEERWEREGREGGGEVYVSVGRDVYDVSNIMTWADDAIMERLGRYAGRELTDPGLVHDIVKCNVSNGIVGRLVEGAWVRPRPSKEWFDRERERLRKEITRFEDQDLAYHNLRYGPGCGTGRLRAMKKVKKKREMRDKEMDWEGTGRDEPGYGSS